MINSILSTGIRNSFILFLVLSLCSCNQSKNSNADLEKETDSTNQLDSLKTDNTMVISNTLYSWVDKLNIRDTPSLKGRSVTSAQSDEALTYKGEKSDKTEMIVLRGVLYDEPWLKVETKNGEEGWVFGGAVKAPNESKGNEIISDTDFDFPHFGNFDLKEWKNLGTKDESGGDADINTTTYKRRSLTLEFSKVEVGEYGYQRLYKLIDANGKIVKERAFKHMADYQFGEMIEEVKDYTVSPAVRYKRSQIINKHYSQLNSLPLMVNGDWVQSELTESNN